MSLIDDLFTIHNSDTQLKSSEFVIMNSGRFFKGGSYQWTVYGEDAFVFPSRESAELVIKRYPDTFKEAYVHERKLAASS